MLTIILGMENYKADVAATMQEGLEKTRRGNYDLILLDWYIIDGTGLELCLKIREFDQRTPILFYSAVADAPHVKQAMEAGAQGYLVKPIGIDDLMQKVARYTGVSKEHESNQ